jgi:hypothetical protein
MHRHIAIGGQDLTEFIPTASAISPSPAPTWTRDIRRLAGAPHGQV